MTRNELKSTLSEFSKFSALHNTTKDNLFSWYWSILVKYLEGRNTIGFEELKIFDEFFPGFTTQVRRYGTTRADEIHKKYNKLTAQYFNKLRSVEDANPAILYLQSPGKVYVRTNCAFIPFGKFEEPADKFYFLNVILSQSNQQNDSDEHSYEHFKKYVYTYFVSTHLKHFPPSYNFILESDLESLRQIYPDFVKKFEEESIDFLDTLGYYEAHEQFVLLKKEENDELSKISSDVAEQLVAFNIEKRQVTVEY